MGSDNGSPAGSPASLEDQPGSWAGTRSGSELRATPAIELDADGRRPWQSRTRNAGADMCRRTGVAIRTP